MNEVVKGKIALALYRANITHADFISESRPIQLKEVSTKTDVPQTNLAEFAQEIKKEVEAEKIAKEERRLKKLVVLTDVEALRPKSEMGRGCVISKLKNFAVCLLDSKRSLAVFFINPVVANLFSQIPELANRAEYCSVMPTHQHGMDVIHIAIQSYPEGDQELVLEHYSQL